jgi:hypothetical protein
MHDRRSLARGVVLALALAACHPGPEPAPRPPLADAEAPAPEACGAACAVLARLGCPEAAPTAAGEPCDAFCVRVERSGKFSLRPTCVAAAVNRDDLGKCNVRCPPIPPP